MDFSKLLMFVPGIIIFLVGSGQQRRRPGLFSGTSSAQGTVTGCDHVVKKDRQGRETYNYYNVTVEFRNPETGQTERRAVKSPTEYYPAQQVLLLGVKSGEQTRITGAEDETLFPPLAVMAGGALLILLAFWENQMQESRAMCCLVLILLGAGILLLRRYVNLKSRNLEPIEAEITEIYTRQLSRETKLLKGAKYAYYPVVRYEIDGKPAMRRLNVNSSGEKSYKVGEKLTLYLDRERGAVTESHAGPGLLIAAIIILALGLVSAGALIPALLG